jgi:hypothetical protein
MSCLRSANYKILLNLAAARGNVNVQVPGQRRWLAARKRLNTRCGWLAGRDHSFTYWQYKFGEESEEDMV